jgi:tetratricopeptide (TPR) repeat protein
MRSTRVSFLALVALLVLCFGLAAYLDTWFQAWAGNRGQSANLLGVLLGDSRRLFANHFYVKADAYFHSGFYPTVFDNNEAFRTPHMAEDSGTVGGRNQGDENGFLGRPRDWIDAFSRQFFPSAHTHLDQGGAPGHGGSAGDLGGSSDVREILPWLRLSAELDPNHVETYTVTAYWLRERMGKAAEAEQFLREGLRENPNSYEILYELGRVYAENKNEPARARNLWEAALRQWQRQDSEKAQPDKFLFLEITSHLALVEEQQGNLPKAIAYMEMWKSKSPSPAEIQQRIDELQQRAAGKTKAP